MRTERHFEPKIWVKVNWKTWTKKGTWTRFSNFWYQLALCVQSYLSIFAQKYSHKCQVTYKISIFAFTKIVLEQRHFDYGLNYLFLFKVFDNIEKKLRTVHCMCRLHPSFATTCKVQFSLFWHRITADNCT